jgi:hypothetical protein
VLEEVDKILKDNKINGNKNEAMIGKDNNDGNDEVSDSFVDKLYNKFKPKPKKKEFTFSSAPISINYKPKKIARSTVNFKNVNK